MEKNVLKKIAVILLTGVLVIPTAKADRRKYAWAYQSVTIAPGVAELEFYQTTKLNEVDSWEYRIEIEHGLTSRWDLSIYEIFAQTEGESLKWDAFQIRTRYRLAAPGAYFLDPLFYLEYHRKVDLKKQNKLEVKLILGKNISQVNIAINPVYEFFWAPGDPVHEFGLDIGLSYEVSYQLSFGIETSSRVKVLKDANDKTGSYLGPTISFATGPLFYTVGYGRGLTDDSDNARVRLLIGVEL